jgi:hypothetical protein
MPARGDAAGSIRFDAPKFPGQQGKGDYVLVIDGSLVVRKGPMVDPCEGWEVQDGERKDLRSKRHFRGQG